jgi:hypothetical protein
MSNFTIPPDMVSLLGQFKERTELRDPAGNIIGVFTPRDIFGQSDGQDCLFDLEEAERILREERDQPWLTLDEIWRKLGRDKSKAE